MKIKRTINYGGKRPDGWVLAHNAVKASVNTKHGERGFRRFWCRPTRNGNCVRAGGGLISVCTTR